MAAWLALSYVRPRIDKSIGQTVLLFGSKQQDAPRQADPGAQGPPLRTAKKLETRLGAGWGSNKAEPGKNDEIASMLLH